MLELWAALAAAEPHHGLGEVLLAAAAAEDIQAAEELAGTLTQARVSPIHPVRAAAAAVLQ